MTEHPTAAGAVQSGSAALGFDVVAGLTAAAVVLPKAMAYATVAGLPVAVGLYTAFVPMLIYALLGSSRVLSVSSTTTLAILTGTQLGLAVPDGDPGRLLTATRRRDVHDGAGEQIAARRVEAVIVGAGQRVTPGEPGGQSERLGPCHDAAFDGADIGDE